jgi:hypothetical protein
MHPPNQDPDSQHLLAYRQVRSLLGYSLFSPAAQARGCCLGLHMKGR